MCEYEPIVVEDAWDLLESGWDMYYALCKRYARGRMDLADELMGEVVDRVPKLVETWDPTEDDLRPYVLGSLHWYLYKRVVQESRRGQRYGSLTSHVGNDDVQIDVICTRSHADDAQRYNIDTVRALLSRLPEDEQTALTVLFLEDGTIEDLQSALGVSRQIAKRTRDSALKHARENTD